jgi:hypothetical protein
MVCFQVDVYSQRYRALSFFVACAVDQGRDQELRARIQVLNGELPEEKDEILTASLFKDYASGVSPDDVGKFFDWLLQPSIKIVRGREKITNCLRELKHERLARFHVFCPNGRVPNELSM